MMVRLRERKIKFLENAEADLYLEIQGAKSLLVDYDYKTAGKIRLDSLHIGLDNLKLMTGIKNPEDSKIAHQIVEKYKNVKVVKAK